MIRFSRSHTISTGHITFNKFKHKKMKSLLVTCKNKNCAKFKGLKSNN